ncbi:MAG: RIP metalloprotease RseP [Hyphomicrobiaceae bacterium]
MSFINNMAGSLGGLLFGLAAFLFVLSIVVFVHEMGHFLVARWCGVKVSAFSLGFGPEIYGFDDKHGTRWRFAWIPLGGYVKFMDDENGASMPMKDRLEKMTPEERAVSFHGKPLWQKAAVVAAGPIANFLLAIAIFAFLFMTIGVTTIPPRVDAVIPGSVAERAGFKSGDLIVSINGKSVDAFQQLQQSVNDNVGSELTFGVDRAGQIVTLKATPELSEVADGLGGKAKMGKIGVQLPAKPQDLRHKTYGPIDSVVMGVEKSYGIVRSTFAYLSNVITGRQSADQLGGPVRIANASGKIAKMGLDQLVYFVAFISVSLGLVNLFPVPILDGGHLTFYAIEALRGKPLNEDTQEMAFRVGFGLIMALMLFAFWNDRFILLGWLPGSG